MIILSHTLEEVNLILSSLAKQSYETVHELIEKIKTQAVPQVQANTATSPGTSTAQEGAGKTSEEGQNG